MPEKFQHIISQQLKESGHTISETANQAELLERAAEALIAAFKRGNKIMTFGNGGSSCDAQNFADELVGRFDRNRPPLSAIALTVSQADLTSIGNDFGFDQVFARQLRAHARPGDIAVAISTSGNSPNVLEAVKAAKELRIFTIGLTGQDGGKLKNEVDLCVKIPSKNVARIQEAHITVIQIWCGLIEDTLFPNAPKAH